MKVLMLSRYGRLGASSRMRSLQYIPWLEAAGIHLSVSPLFSDIYVRDLQYQRRNLAEALSAYVRRAAALVRCDQAVDLLWIEKEALPWLPVWLERVLLKNNIPYVLDYDDAVFHSYDQNPNPLVRWALSGKHPALMSGASLVVAGNQYLADFARAAGAPFVTVLPTVIDLDRYPDSLVLSSKKSSFPPCVGWVGQRSTAFFLSPYRDIFTKITEAGLGRFSAVGIDTKALGLPMDSVEWSEKTEVSSISNFDVGIMPLVDEPFARGKCGYKLIQYMACGLPVVASPVGVNCQIVEHGVNGFLVETQTEWESALRTLLLNPDLRKKMGQAGRRKVEDQFSLQVTAPRLAALLKSVCEVP